VKRFFTYFSIMMVCFLLLSAGGYFWFQKQMKANGGIVEIFEGASVQQVTEMLEIEGIVPNGEFMYNYIRAKNYYYRYKNLPNDEWYPQNFKHGKFHLSGGDLDDIIVQLNSSKAIEDDFVRIVIPEGKGIEFIADALEKENLFSKEEFLTAANDKENYLQFKSLYPWLPSIKKEKRYLMEGYLQANTYKIGKNATPEEVIDKMLKETNRWYKESANYQSSLTFDQALTLASVVEAEGKFSEDRPKIAQVFINRIKQKMPLQSDMTAAYANGKHKVFMYEKDIKVQSPYNTYVVKGLPIGPINSPSKESLLAVFHPSGDNYFYFYARPNGETLYAKTWKEHEKNRMKWEHEWKKLEKKN